MRLSVFGLLALVGGCTTFATADLVSFDFESRSGVVSYLNDGYYQNVIEARKTKAEQIMKDQCKGQYQITKLMNQGQYVGSYTTASANPYSATPSASAMSFAAYQNYAYLAFECQ